VSATEASPDPFATLTAWQLTGAAYRALVAHSGAALRVTALPATLLIATSLVLGWSSAGEMSFLLSLLLLTLFFAAQVSMTFLIFVRWSGVLRGFARRSILMITGLDREVGSSWLLASLVWWAVCGLAATLGMMIMIGGLALSGETTDPGWRREMQAWVDATVMVFVIPASMLASVAAGRRFLLASARAAGLPPSDRKTQLVLRSRGQARWAYATAPLPFLLSSYAVLEIADHLGPEWWALLLWSLFEPLNTVFSTLLVGAIGVAAIQAATAQTSDEPCL
jgi:hypothetical protein